MFIWSSNLEIILRNAPSCFKILVKFLDSNFIQAHLKSDQLESAPAPKTW